MESSITGDIWMRSVLQARHSPVAYRDPRRLSLYTTPTFQPFRFVGFLGLALFLGSVYPAAGSDLPDSGLTGDEHDIASTVEAHLNFLADDSLAGRNTGTVEYQIAANYIASQFQQFGLEAVGSDGSYFQPVNYKTTQILEESISFEVLEGSGSKKWIWKEDFAISGDTARLETEIDADLVFVGFGIDAPELGVTSYLGIDVENKVVVQLTGAPQSFPGDQRAHYSSRTTKKETAADHGAIAVLWIPNRSDEERRPWRRRSRRAGSKGYSWAGPEGKVDLQSLRTSGYLKQESAAALFEGTENRLEEVLDQAESSPLEVGSFDLNRRVKIAFQSEHSQVMSPNVVGRLPGSDPELRHETLVYSAHLDHVGMGREVDGDSIYNGAYDNAMGTAITLAVAEAMADLPVAPKRSVLFLLVGGEEKGLLGSSYFTHFPTVPIGNIIANVNIDMPLLLTSLDEVIAFGAEHSTLAEPIALAASAHGFTLVPDPKPEQMLFVRSDQYSFVRRGVPSVYLVPGFHSTDPEVDGVALVEDFVEHHYHRPSDDLSQPVDWKTAVRFTKTNLQLGLEIANGVDRPRWNDGDFFGEVFGEVVGQ